MELYLKQKIFSWNDKFYVYDQNGNEIFYVEGELFSWGKKLHIYDMSGKELAFIRQKVWSFLPRYFIDKDGEQVAEVVREFTFFRQKYTVKGLGWNVDGNFWQHDYAVSNAAGNMVASVSKEWFTFGDAYKISVIPNGTEVTVLAIVLIIDACLDADRRNSANS